MMNEQEEIKGRKQDNKDRKDGAKERGEWWGKGRRRRKSATDSHETRMQG